MGKHTKLDSVITALLFMPVTTKEMIARVCVQLERINAWCVQQEQQQPGVKKQIKGDRTEPVTVLTHFSILQRINLIPWSQ